MQTMWSWIEPFPRPCFHNQMLMLPLPSDRNGKLTLILFRISYSIYTVMIIVLSKDCSIFLAFMDVWIMLPPLYEDVICDVKDWFHTLTKMWCFVTKVNFSHNLVWKSRTFFDLTAFCIHFILTSSTNLNQYLQHLFNTWHSEEWANVFGFDPIHFSSSQSWLPGWLHLMPHCLTCA